MKPGALNLLLADRFQRIRIVVAVLVMIGALAYADHAFAHPLWTFDLYYFSGAVERHGSYTDIPSVLALATNAHRVILDEGAYGAPTLLALFFQPLSLLPLNVAHVMWEAIVVAAAVFSIRKAAGQTWPLWLMAFSVTPVFLLAAGVANAVLLTTPLLIYAYAALRDNQNKRAGVALALAVALKMYPAFLILALIVSRRWKALWATLAGLVGLGAATVLALGWDDAVTAARFTLHLSNNVHAGGQNVSLAGTLVQFVDGTGFAHVALYLSLALAACAVVAVRKLPAHLAFAAASAAMLFSQSMTWREYTMLAVVCALALKDSHMAGVDRRLVIVGVVLCVGTSWTPFGLETGINFLSQGLANAAGDSRWLSAPSATQTLGLLLCLVGFVRTGMRPTAEAEATN